MNQLITDVVSAFRMPTEFSSPGRNIREREVRTLIQVGLSTTTDTSKPDSRTANHDAAIDIEGAESLVSLRLQQAATSADDTEEDLEDVHAPKTGSRGRCKNQLVIGLTYQ